MPSAVVLEVRQTVPRTLVRSIMMRVRAAANWDLVAHHLYAFALMGPLNAASNSLDVTSMSISQMVQRARPRLRQGEML